MRKSEVEECVWGFLVSGCDRRKRNCMRGWGVKKGWERGICGSEREPGITMKLMCEEDEGFGRKR